MSQQPVSDFKRQIQASTKVPAWGKSAKPTVPPPQQQSYTSQASSSSQPAPTAEAGPSQVLPGKKKNKKSDVVWSQPSDTGTGTQRGTQLAFVLDFLKKSQNPIRLEDLALLSEVPTLETDPLLLEAFERDENVNKNPNNGLYTWKRVYHSRTPEQLLNEIRSKGRDGGGLSVKALKEGFPEVVQHIEQLEQQGKVLVTRNAKDNAPKFVFWNEITTEQGGKMVDAEFVEIWDKLTNPVEADLLKALERSGLQATVSEDLPAQAPKGKKKKPKAQAKRIHKITNTHIDIAGIDLTKDYVKPSASTATS
ncbi:hypothetical protein FRB94_004987 [Tulasnella sp. JGI-2019a]|nr:hypothetical protein FRB93_009601 [Tulasnella sp. JGI-2019a]KAG9012841.1 hypothetical protein FRB94_004987 [Tulasnella sp. JGI-2019a]KAG9037606.1 hypothetical protein FRB95_004826 [Tulasnella sp. JGI-2019a]